MSSSFCLSEEPFSETLCFNHTRKQLLTTDLLRDLHGDESRCPAPESDKQQQQFLADFKRHSDAQCKVKDALATKVRVADEGVPIAREESLENARSRPSFSSATSSASPVAAAASTTTTITTSTAAAACPTRDQQDSTGSRKDYSDIKRGSGNSQARQRSSDRSSSLSTSSSSSAMKLKALKGDVQPGSSIFSNNNNGSNNKAGNKNAVLCRRLDECAHFHYDMVELKTIELSLVEDNFEDDYSDKWLIMEVVSKERQWKVKRSFHSLHQMDKQLHDCIFKRKFSTLPELTENLVEEEGHIRARGKVCTYFDVLTTLPVSRINCGPVLCWMEMDNRGNRVILPDSDSAINIPAVAAAHCIKPYTAQSVDELSLKVGDILSIIDKPPPNESSWWRGKKDLEVGFFPSDCVELLESDKLPHSIASRCAVNTHLKHSSSIGRRNKLKSLLMSFFSTRPNRSSLKRSGIVRERLFGCDLGEHLLNSDEEVPAILKCCAEVLEVHGIVDGIYRLSGAASTINKLRNEFDEGRLPDLTCEMYIQDIHSVSSLLKMYFRELPNPLLTYELYDKFIEAITGKDEEVRLPKICDVIRQLPPPHYRTAEYLFRHLNKMASQDDVTSMHCKNLAIVWAPNLLRSKELEQMNCGTAALRGVGIQAIVTEYLIKNVGVIFNEENQSCDDGISTADPSIKPKSFSPMPTTQKLLSLEEAQERKSQLVSTHLRQKNFIEVGAGSAGLPIKYHTVIYPKAHQAKDKKKLREKLPSPSRFRTLFRRSQSTSFKENQAAEVCTKPSSAREKKTSSVGSEAPPGDSTDKKSESSGKRNLSTSALLSNGTPAGDASFGILDDLKRLSTSCEIPAEAKEKQSKSGANKKLKKKHRSTSVDVASSELDTLLSVHVDADESSSDAKSGKVTSSREKSSKKRAPARRRSPVPSAAASSTIPEGSSGSKGGKKSRKSEVQRKTEITEAKSFVDEGLMNVEAEEHATLVTDEERLLDRPVLASDESDFKSDSLEAFEVAYADGLRASPLDSKTVAGRLDSGKMSNETRLVSDENFKVVAAASGPTILAEEDPGKNPEKEEATSTNREGIDRQNGSRNDLLAWSLSSDVTGKDLYKELSPTFHDIWSGGGRYGSCREDEKSAHELKAATAVESEATETEEPPPLPSLPSPAEVRSEDLSIRSSDPVVPASDLVPSPRTTDDEERFGYADYLNAEEREHSKVTEEDLDWKMNNFEVALNILEQSCDLKPQPKEVVSDIAEGSVLTPPIKPPSNDDDDPVFLLPEVGSTAGDDKFERKSFCGSPEDLPKPRSTAKSTSSIPPPSTESLSDAALDLFSIDRMYSSESLGRAKLQVSNEDGYVCASYRDLYVGPSDKRSDPNSASSSKAKKLTSAPVMAPDEEREILRKLSSYGVGTVGERTVMMPVGNAAKKSDFFDRNKTRNTVPSSYLSARIDEVLFEDSENIRSSPSRPVTSSFRTSSQASTDPLRRKENVLSSPASSSSCKESSRDKTEFLLRPSSNSAFRNHHHRHSSRHFDTPSPESVHSSITPPLPAQTMTDPFGAHASSVRLTSREIKMWQDRAAQKPASIEPSRSDVEQKSSKSNDARSYHHQPPVIILNRPSSILRNETTGAAQKSDTRQTAHFGVSKSSRECTFGQPRSPLHTQPQFPWSQKQPSNSGIETGRKSLPAAGLQFRKSISLDENGEEEKAPVLAPICGRSDMSQHSQSSSSSSKTSFSRSETRQTERSAKEERFSTSFFHQKEVSVAASAKFPIASSLKSSQTSDRPSSVTPPTPRANQTFVLAKKQLFENNGNC